MWIGASALVCILSSSCAPSPTIAGTCPPASYSRTDLLALREGGFIVADATVRESLALALLGCLGDPDPSLRDGVAFEGLSTWMRTGQLSPETASEMLDSLLPRIAPGYPDPEGFERPFVALVLSEVARMDRVTPFLPPERRDALVDGAVDFMKGVDDYRGFDERDGWRHGVAHGADLVMQLSLSPSVDEPALHRLLEALAAQVAPPGEHFYVYGEPERLARAAFWLASRDVVSEADWSDWFAGITDPAPLPTWDAAFQSQTGLAKRHDTAAFLLALHLMVSEDASEFTRRLRPGLEDAIRRVP
jgi:hypothetical protein